MANPVPGMTRPHPITPSAGQESVWDYPRPPDLVPSSKRVRIEWNGHVVASTGDAIRVRETSHPPCWGIPPGDVEFAHLTPSTRRTACEWKGEAIYWDLTDPERTVESAAWSYPHPEVTYRAIAGYLFFYPARVDRCLVDGELAVPQPGDFYGGWITAEVVGPFKGQRGTLGW